MPLRLARADYVTLAGLGLGWTVISLLLLEQPDLATLLLLVAFLCDKADGSLARRGHGSPLGPQLDALADVVIYLVPIAVLIVETLAARSPAGFIAGASIILFGVLRLARHSVGAQATDGGTTVYYGITAFHVAAWGLTVRLVIAWTVIPALVGTVVIGAVGPLMIAPIRIDVTKYQLTGAILVGVVLGTASLLRVFGWV